MPLISVVVPVYNVENKLSRCIESILDQTFDNFELILIDDGSSDRSGSICDRYEIIDKRIFVVHKENGGVSSARNLGMEIAKGKYLAFIDGDDDVNSNYLKTLVNIYNDDIQLAICGFNWIDSGKIVKTSVYSKNRQEIVMKDNIMDIQSKNLISSPWCKLYLTETIKKNNILFPNDVSLGEDLMFNFKYLDFVHRIGIVNDTLYNYNLDNGQSLLRVYRSDLQEINKKINSVILEFLKTWNVSNYQLELFYNKKYYDYEYAMLNTFSKYNKDSFFKKIETNKKIIKSSDFNNTLKLSTVKINFLYKFAYKINSYTLIYIFNKLHSTLWCLNEMVKRKLKIY